MLEPISQRAIGSHVSFTSRRVQNALTFTYHKQTQRRLWLAPRTRLFTTTTTRYRPAQSPQPKLNVFVPPDVTSIEPESGSLKRQSGALSGTSSNASPIPILKPITTHHNLETYQAYQRQRLLATADPQVRHRLNSSTVHLGTRYEYLIQSHLQAHFGFTLTRIGGKGDGGIDLIGTWTLPVPVPVSASSSTLSAISGVSSDPNDPSDSHVNQPRQPSFRILLQAKRMSPSRKPMPALMRELDGSILSAASARWISAAFLTHNMRTSTVSSHVSDGGQDLGRPRSESRSQSPLLSDLSHLPTLGILVTTRPLTAGIEQAMASSPRCLMYVCLEEVDDDGHAGTDGRSLDGWRTPATRIRQMVWNAAATRAGLRGYEVIGRFSDHGAEDSSSSTSDVVMMFQGQPIKAS